MDFETMDKASAQPGRAVCPSRAVFPDSHVPQTPSELPLRSQRIRYSDGCRPRLWFQPLLFPLKEPGPQPLDKGLPRGHHLLYPGVGLAFLPPTSHARPVPDSAHEAAPSITFPGPGSPTSFSPPTSSG